MVLYFCPRCNYSTTHKYSFKNHLEKKKVCKPLLSDIDIITIKNEYNLNKTNTKLNQTTMFSRVEKIELIIEQPTNFHTKTNNKKLIDIRMKLQEKINCPFFNSYNYTIELEKIYINLIKNIR